jgi:hypothetical protein
MSQSEIQSIKENPVIQFSIYADNKVGRLNEVIQLFGTGGIQVMAISLLDNTESTLFRVVVNYPEQAKALLDQRPFSYSQVEVVAVELDSLDQIPVVTCTLAAAEINIQYVYAFISRPQGKCALVLNLEDNEMGTHVLHCAGLKMLTQMDLGR